MTKRFQQILTLLKDALAYYSLKSKKTAASEKQLWVHVQNPNLYHRFFYLLLKFYQLEGYSIHYPMNFQKFRNLRNGEKYLSFIVKEPDFLTLKNDKNGDLELRDSHLTADYFANYFKGNNKENYHIPMSFHPLMYHKNLWNLKISLPEKRINSVFCYGNFDKRAYSAIDQTPFEVLSRVDLLEFFAKQDQFVSIKNQNHLEEIISTAESEKFLFAIKENYSVPIESVRETLAQFKFYLCCPGVVMPLCHNVVEAMSVGTVPIIQKQYAEVMYPNLEHGKNALIFENENHLHKLIVQELFTIQHENWRKMSENALKYYEEFLTPKAVVESINKNLKHSVIYLNAEHRSVNLINS